MNKKILLTILILLTAGMLPTMGQNDVTMYHMKGLPFNTQLNPSFRPTHGNVFVSFGVFPFSSLAVSASTSKNINYQNLFKNPNFGKIAKNVGDYANLDLNVGLNLANVGFFVKDWYFTVDLGLKTQASVQLNGDLLRVAWYGNGSDNIIGRNMGLDGTGALASVYGELAVGVSKKISADWTVGGKLKYLQGGAYGNLNIVGDSFLHTHPEDYAITVKLDPEMELAGVPVNLNEGEYTMREILESITVSEYKYKPAGHGMGIDLGATWKTPIDKLTASVSVLDLGFINWKGVTKMSSVKAEKVVFESLDVSSSNLLDTLLNRIQDSVMMKVSHNHTKLRGLFPRVYIGANYEINKYLNSGFLFGMRSDKYSVDPMFALSVNTQNLGVNTSLSVSYFNQRPHVGLGFLFGRRGVQGHLILDDILPAFNYLNAESVSIRMGMSFMFGRTTKKIKYYGYI